MATICFLNSFVRLIGHFDVSKIKILMRFFIAGLVHFERGRRDVTGTRLSERGGPITALPTSIASAEQRFA